MKNNITSISSFIISFSRAFEKDIYKKIGYTKNVFKDVCNIVIKYKNLNISEIKKNFKIKYGDMFELLFINNKGIIFDATYKPEIGLNLFDFEDAKKTLLAAKKFSNKIFVDFPVLDSTHKRFNLYLLKYIPERNFYLQLSYKIDLLDELRYFLKSLTFRKNFIYYLNVVYIYKQGEYKDFVNLIYENPKPIDKNIINYLLQSKKHEFFKSNIFGFQYYKILKYDYKNGNPYYNLCYKIEVSSTYNKLIIITVVSINLVLILIYYFLYLLFYKKIKFSVVNPLKIITKNIKNSTPIFDDEITSNIEEFKSLKDSYSYHLENIKLRDFVKNLIAAQEDERKRISKQIHDSVIQDLSYILIKLKKINNKELSDILKNKISELRSLISEHDLSFLQIYGIKTYLKELILNFKNKYPYINFLLDTNFDDDLKLETETSVNFIRIIQEILNNAAIHSNCTEVNIDINVKNNKILLNISDNGSGFDVEYALKKRDHFGLINIKERVYILKGKMKIISNGSGTKYKITIPV